MKICPYCASENIFFSKKRNIYICEDCDGAFCTPSASGGTRLFISYGHDKNAILVVKIKEYLVEHGYDVWIDSSEIPAGSDWRERITNGIIASNGLISFLSKYSIRDPGVCLDELKIAVCLKHAYVSSILLERESEVALPSIVGNGQWIDMSDWETVADVDWDEYFNKKMTALIESLNSASVSEYNREIELISRELHVTDNMTKELRLRKKTFIGRKWLTTKIQNWLNEVDSPDLIIYGVPGAGKSAFVANLVHYNTDVLAGLFFEWDHANLHNIDHVTHLLVLKLSVNLPDYRRIIVTMVKDDSKMNTIKKLHDADLFDYLILDPLLCCIDGGRGTKMIVFDGLDETSDDVAELLIRKADQFPAWIKLLFTSRYDETDAPFVDDKNIVVLDNSHNQNREDLAEYFSYCLDLEPDDNIVSRLVDKSEGSFMYASAMCDAVHNGNITITDESAIPVGLNNFYRVLFLRLFPKHSDFSEIRPFFELLSTEDDVLEEIVCDCMNLTKYELRELYFKVKSLVVAGESNCITVANKKLKSLRFVHKTIKDWLADEEQSKHFYIDIKYGYQRLVDYYKNTVLRYENMPLSFDCNDMANEQNKRNAIEHYSKENYIKWLIYSGYKEEAKKALMDSFDAETMKKNHNYSNYTEYYSLYDLWQWADLFPSDYHINDLVDKMRDIAIYPHQYGVSRYAHRSYQITAFIFSHILKTGRYKKAFDSFIREMYYALYFMSRASDDGETRDGWDKLYMAQNIAICLKQLMKAGVDVDNDVRERCELIKLTYVYCNGKYDNGMFAVEELHKYIALNQDVCVLSKHINYSVEILELQRAYNTAGFINYLTDDYAENDDFVSLCKANNTDIDSGCKVAIEKMNKRHKTARMLKRITYIERLQNNSL